MSAAPTPEQPSARFGTFTGVFTPTLLTILGVIMYVRLGWVVGNAGLAGAMLIMGLAILITTCTGLSLASIATNTRIGAGGPYAIMTRSLGLEVGGSIGIPLYLTRPLGVAMYIFGFREGVLWVFPTLPALAVDLLSFVLLFGIAYKSAEVAFKAQYVIMAIIGLSLLSIFLSPAPGQATHEVGLWGTYPGAPETDFVGTDFWGVFAVFFPATTGILAGANMSGDLKDPRRAIPVGTLAAIAVSTVVYGAVALWVANVASLEELTGNYNVIIDHALFPPLVLAGLLGATASSALAGLVGGPRILMAMGQNRIIPYSEAMARIDGGEPRNALLVTGALTLACIMVRDLNAIAPMVTMFFLITYCMINVVVLIESSLGLVSYRPTLRLPLVVPLVGLLGCLFSMFIVSPTVSLIAVGVSGVVYVMVRQRGVEQATKEDVRSSIFVAMAEWAAGRVTPEDLGNVRAWKPHVLVPVEDAEELRGSFRMLLDLVRPEGTVKLMGLASRHPVEELEPRIEELGHSLREQGLLASWSMIAVDDYVNAVAVGAMALQGAFFRPNLLMVRLPPDAAARRDTARVLQQAHRVHVGAILYIPHPQAGLGRQQEIALWVRHGGDSWDAAAAFDGGNLNLILLLGYRLLRSWKGRLTLLTVASDEDQGPRAEAFLDELCDLARFPQKVRRVVLYGDFETCLRQAPPADLAIFGMHRPVPDLDRTEQVTHLARCSTLFVMDSGREDARA